MYACGGGLEHPFRERYRRVKGQQRLGVVSEHVADKVEGEQVLHDDVGKPVCALVGWRFVSVAWRRAWVSAVEGRCARSSNGGASWC